MCFTAEVFIIFYFGFFLLVDFFYGLQKLVLWASLTHFDSSHDGTASFSTPHSGLGSAALCYFPCQCRITVLFMAVPRHVGCAEMARGSVKLTSLALFVTFSFNLFVHVNSHI